MTKYSTATFIMVIVIGTWLILEIQPDAVSTLPPGVIIDSDSKTLADRVQFNDITLRLGINARHHQNSGKLTSLTETLGGGLCVFDVNKDGWQDVLFITGSGTRRHYGQPSWWSVEQTNKLYLNTSSGRQFVDVTEQYGLDSSSWGMGCVTADLNNDSLPDLIIFGIGANQLYINNGNGFVRKESVAGFNEDIWTTGALVEDVNHDGLLDIYVTNFIRYEQGQKTYEKFSGFDVTSRGPFDAKLYDASPNQLLINQGDFKFIDKAEEFGVVNAQGRSLGAQWTELNDDGWRDLIVLNDHGTPNVVFINQAGAGFLPANQDFFPLALAGSRALLVDDIDGDTALEFIFSRGTGFHHSIIDGSGQIKDISRESGFGRHAFVTESTWGLSGGDFNLDGSFDFIAANGLMFPDIDSGYMATGQSNRIFLNDDTGEFSSYYFDPFDETKSSRSVARIDIDNDGRLDFIVGNNNSVYTVYENNTETENNWLTISLDALDVEIPGTKVRISTGESHYLRIAGLAQGFISQSDKRIHFGLGTAEKIDEIEIVWAGGKTTRLSDVAVNQLISVADNAVFKAEPTANYKKTQEKNRFDEWDSTSIKLLAEVLYKIKDSDYINLLWSSGNTNAMVAIVSQIQRNDTIESIWFLKSALQSEDVGVVLAGLKTAKRIELEQSIDWIIPLVRHNDFLVSCKASEVLEHFFEEEAVIRNKYLSVKALIRVLAGKSQKKATCAARALAAAEKKRAVEPLMALLSISTNDLLLAQVVRSLGLIRDTKAISALSELILHEEINADVAASVIVALIRLDQESDMVFALLKAKPLAIRIQILSALYQSEDTAVLSREELNAALTRSLEQLSTVSDERVVSSALVAMGQSKESGFSELVEDFLEHENRDIRQQAYISLSFLAGDTGRFDNLVNEDLVFIEGVLERIPGRSLSDRTIIGLIEKGVSSAALTKMASGLSATPLRVVMEYVLSNQATVSMASWLEACANSRSSPIHTAMFASLAPELMPTTEAIGCFLFKPQHKLRNRDLLAKRVLVRQATEKLDNEQVKVFRTQLAAYDDFYANGNLFSKISNDSAHAVLNYLAANKSDTELLNRIKIMAGDAGLSRYVRLRAVGELVDIDPSDANRLLEGLIQ